ncbi:metacaspase-6-like isoform X2 [Diospyros lotus]|uniref:metacaspase-6-like isoform X2 n=1 Tax=Diospyros lotus TaxID=55363 RepID=UPI00225B2FE2|nr:metacaspase-6-like isoform X2 [Diospyros lotus]
MGRKMAVLIGCNYPGTEEELMGCVNDVRRMHKCLVRRFGFYDRDIEVLIDTDDDFPKPTGRNIRDAITDMVRSAKFGDVLFVHFSGHGIRLPPRRKYDNTGYDECIIPTDSNLITDDDFRHFVNEVPKGCRITIVADSCHSGGLIAYAKEQIGESTKKQYAPREYSPQRHHHYQYFDQGSSSSSYQYFEQGSSSSRHHHRQDSSLGHHHSQHLVNRESQAGYRYQRTFEYKYLSPSKFVKMLKRKTGKDDIYEGNLRQTLFDIFGEDVSPKIKLDVNALNMEVGEILNGIGNLAQNFHKLNLEDSSNLVTYARGTTNPTPPRRGILISACQSDQSAADDCGSGKPREAFGALSNVIQIIIDETKTEVTNRTLVLKARQMLKKQGFTQRPGLYCSDYDADALFLS